MAFLNIGQILYPKGSIFWSFAPVEPGSFLGGNWKSITVNHFLKPVSTTTPAKSVRGSNKFVLTASNLPPHSHPIKGGYRAVSTGTPGSSDAVHYQPHLEVKNTSSFCQTKILPQAGSIEGYEEASAVTLDPTYYTCYAWERVS